MNTYRIIKGERKTTFWSWLKKKYRRKLRGYMKDMKEISKSYRIIPFILYIIFFTAIFFHAIIIVIISFLAVIISTILCWEYETYLEWRNKK